MKGGRDRSGGPGLPPEKSGRAAPPRGRMTSTVREPNDVFRVDRKAKHWHHEQERSTGAKGKERRVGEPS